MYKFFEQKKLGLYCRRDQDIYIKWTIGEWREPSTLGYAAFPLLIDAFIHEPKTACAVVEIGERVANTTLEVELNDAMFATLRITQVKVWSCWDVFDLTLFAANLLLPVFVRKYPHETRIGEVLAKMSNYRESRHELQEQADSIKSMIRPITAYWRYPTPGQQPGLKSEMFFVTSRVYDSLVNASENLPNGGFALNPIDYACRYDPDARRQIEKWMQAKMQSLPIFSE